MTRPGPRRTSTCRAERSAPRSRCCRAGLIGFVGATGLATGPHVCYRVLKDGEPVDALALRQSPTTSIAPGLRRAFIIHRDSLRPRLGL